MCDENCRYRFFLLAKKRSGEFNSVNLRIFFCANRSCRNDIIRVEDHLPLSIYLKVSIRNLFCSLFYSFYVLTRLPGNGNKIKWATVAHLHWSKYDIFFPFLFSVVSCTIHCFSCFHSILATSAYRSFKGRKISNIHPGVAFYVIRFATKKIISSPHELFPFTPKTC